MKRWIKIVALGFSSLLTAPLLFAVSQGPFYATAIGTTQWSNSTNALGAPDNQCATETSATHAIDLVGFGFSIPAAAIIQGITVELKFADSSTGGALAQLLKGGVPVGTYKTFFRPSGATSCSTSAFLTLGGSVDLWGATWTAADINASNFGVRVEKDGISGTIYLDSVRITVEYQDVMQVAMESGTTLSSTINDKSIVELGVVEFTGQTTLRVTATRNWRVCAKVSAHTFPSGADDPTANALQVKDYLGSWQPGGSGVIVGQGTPTPAEGSTFTVDQRVTLASFNDGKIGSYQFNLVYSIDDQGNPCP
ncbi:hypothetical protein LM602_07380 [Candidatus Acetothermia bacterium]|nr:hypothetical protein [Candidatus Acetothermia bacterium]